MIIIQIRIILFRIIYMFFLHPVHHAAGLAVTLELVFRPAEEVADPDVAALVLDVGTLEDFLHTFF